MRLADVRVERLDRFARVVASHYLVCTVLVSLISDDKQELLETVVVETRTGHPAPLEWERWRRLRLDTRPVFDAEGRDTLPGPGDLEHAWQYAVVRVERQLAKTLASHTRQAAVRRDVEEARARSYFEENEADLRRRLERAQASADTTPEVAHRAAALAQKLAANQAEWERRQADIAAKHRLMVRFTLLNAGLITQPKLVARVRV